MEARSALAVLAASLVALGVVPGLDAAHAATDVVSPWRRPVDGALVRPFVEPVARYGAGHRGVDFAADGRTAVHAANAGTVVFAGSVAGSLHVVLLHPGGLRTSYAFLSRIDVRRGDAVPIGAVVGIAGGSAPGHPAGVLHFGLRVGERYVDPMALFSPPDLSRIIRLTLVDQPAQPGLEPPAFEQRSLAEALHLARGELRAGDAPDADDSGGGLDLLGLGASAVNVVGDAAGTAVDAVGAPVASAASWVYERSLAPVVNDAREVASRLGSWLSSRRRCTANTAAPPGGGGSGHQLLAVAGIGSETDPATGAPLALDAAGLGYEPSEVRYFSYRAGRAEYHPRETWGDLLRQAVSLRTQLRAMQAAAPGREVDLVGHSQGGVVLDAFLQLVYDPADPTLPPLGTVVTLASPHEGSPVASLVGALQSTAAGREALAELRHATGNGMPPGDARALRQLAENSPLLRRLWRRRLPDHVELTSISGADDVIVPANHTSVPGGSEVTVNPDGLADHTGILHDPAATAAVRLALEGRAPPCVAFVDGLRGAVEPVVISRVEHALDALARDVGRLVPELP